MCECIFCHKEQIVTDFIYEDEQVMAFMDMDPINEGHVLLVPKQHYLDVDNINQRVNLGLYSFQSNIIWMWMKYRMNCWRI